MPAIASNENVNPKNILLKAIAATKQATFKATIDIYTNGEIQKTIKVYHLFNPEGTVLEKVENIWPDGQKEAYVTNQFGTYVFIGTSVMKSDTPITLWQGIYTNANLYVPEDTSYSIADGSYKGTPCHAVTLSMPTQSSYVDDIVDRFHTMQNAKEYVTTKLPFTKTYLIGKDNLFIYSCTYFNLNGIKTFSTDWGELDLNCSIDSKQYETPQGDTTPLKGTSGKFRYILSLFALPDTDKNMAESLKKPKEESISDKARDILFKAMRVSGRKNFKAICVSYKGGKIFRTITSYHKTTPEGAVSERTEYLWPNGWQETFFCGTPDTHVLINGIYVKINFMMGTRIFIYTSVKNDVAEDTIYSISDDKYKDIPCYKITEKIPSDADYVNQRITRLQRYSKESKAELLEHLEFARTYMVGKEDNFIYSCAFYNIQGRRTLVEEWGDVKFDEPMSDSLFVHPQGSPAFTAKNGAEFEHVMAKCNNISSAK